MKKMNEVNYRVSRFARDNYLLVPYCLSYFQAIFLLCHYLRDEQNFIQKNYLQKAIQAIIKYITMLNLHYLQYFYIEYTLNREMDYRFMAPRSGTPNGIENGAEKLKVNIPTNCYW